MTQEVALEMCNEGAAERRLPAEMSGNEPAVRGVTAQMSIGSSWL